MGMHRWKRMPRADADDLMGLQNSTEIGHPRAPGPKKFACGALGKVSRRVFLFLGARGPGPQTLWVGAHSPRTQSRSEWWTVLPEIEKLKPEIEMYICTLSLQDAAEGRNHKSISTLNFLHGEAAETRNQKLRSITMASALSFSTPEAAETRNRN